MGKKPCGWSVGERGKALFIRVWVLSRLLFACRGRSECLLLISTADDDGDLV